MVLTSARADGRLGDEFDGVIDLLASQLAIASRARSGLRGQARQDVMATLTDADTELLRVARTVLDAETRTKLMSEAEMTLEGFRGRMAPDAFDRARDAAFDRLVRERFGLPMVGFQSEG
jgi:hypothetical protein